jgi:tryptophanyl-tRNA synthetase
VRDSSIEQLEREFEGAGYGDFKLAVGEAVVEYLAPVRERYNALREDELEAILRLGAGKAREIAVETMRDVRAAMGVGPVGPAR